MRKEDGRPRLSSRTSLTKALVYGLTTFWARNRFGPLVTSNSIRSPSLSLNRAAWVAEWYTKTSSPGLMNR